MDREGVDHPLAVARRLGVIGIAEHPVPKFVGQRHATPARSSVAVDDRDTYRAGIRFDFDAAAIWARFAEMRCEGIKPERLAGATKVINRPRVETGAPPGSG